MTRIIDLTAQEAKQHFLKGSSYFRDDFPEYISFEPILTAVSALMGVQPFTDFQAANKKPADYSGVNYSFIANKDGRFGWRPYELIHPTIYVSLVSLKESVFPQVPLKPVVAA